MFPLTPRLRAILEEQIARTEALQRATRQIIPGCFTVKVSLSRILGGHGERHCKSGFWKRDTSGKLIKKVVDRVLHFKRTAVRNLEPCRRPRSAAKKMVAHKTDAIYSRYAIVDEPMLRDAARLLANLYQADKEIASGDS
jgi:hypothetical protein